MYWRTRGVIPHRVEPMCEVLAYISRVSRLYLAYISPSSPLHLHTGSSVRPMCDVRCNTLSPRYSLAYLARVRARARLRVRG